MDQFVKPPKFQNRWYALHSGPDPAVIQPGKLVNKWPGDASPLNSYFTRITKPLVGISPTLSQDTVPRWEKSLKEATVMSYKLQPSSGVLGATVAEW